MSNPSENLYLNEDVFLCYHLLKCYLDYNFSDALNSMCITDMCASCNVCKLAFPLEVVRLQETIAGMRTLPISTQYHFTIAEFWNVMAYLGYPSSKDYQSACAALNSKLVLSGAKQMRIGDLLNDAMFIRDSMRNL